MREEAVTWLRPVPYDTLPYGLHAGAFGARRRYEVHTGVDLYVPEGTAVCAVEDGTVVGVEWFTGPDADPPCPWWNPTQAVLIEGRSGVVLYGEIEPYHMGLGDFVQAGDVVGHVRRVLKNDKGLPTSMLHLELHRPGTTRSSHPWRLDGERPESLLDPTPFLTEAR